MKTKKLGAVVLLSLCGLFPASSAFAFPWCAAVCSPTHSCGGCLDDNGNASSCGAYGCCTLVMTSCETAVGTPERSTASGAPFTLADVLSPEKPAAPALPAFLQ